MSHKKSLQQKALQRFFLLLLLSTIITSVVSYINGPVRRDRNGDEISLITERVRTHGIRERITETRKIGATPSWLKEDITELIRLINEGVDNQGQELTLGQKIIAINALGNSGRDAISATAALKKYLKIGVELELKKASLLALIRVKSVSESINENLDILCELNQKESNECWYAELIRFRLREVISEEESALREKLQISFSKTISDMQNKIANSPSGINLEVLSPENRNVLYEMSLYGKLSEAEIRSLLDIASRGSNIESRVSVINTLGDQVEIPEFVIDELSKLMQYDSNYQIREEALLTLRRVGTENAISNIHAYGHKFLNGEEKPDEANIHPFLQWALSQAEKINGNTKRNIDE